ncbi:hypothetical protein TYRP_005828 [Tyrophagus putrescentiae]|nr:hypothetical protein TYRP_005828 [Tyrophagus putrescentiae]
MNTEIRLNNDTPFLLGVSSAFWDMKVVIEANAVLPIRKSCSLIWINDQTSILLRVYAGDQARMTGGQDNYIGELKLPNEALTFDSEGDLEVTAQVVGTTLKGRITISKNFWWPQLSHLTAERLVREAEQEQPEDDQSVPMEVD